jgi:hypothetical protein
MLVVAPYLLKPRAKTPTLEEAWDAIRIWVESGRAVGQQMVIVHDWIPRQWVAQFGRHYPNGLLFFRVQANGLQPSPGRWYHYDTLLQHLDSEAYFFTDLLDICFRCSFQTVADALRPGGQLIIQQEWTKIGDNVEFQRRCQRTKEILPELDTSRLVAEHAQYPPLCAGGVYASSDVAWQLIRGMTRFRPELLPRLQTDMPLFNLTVESLHVDGVFFCPSQDPRIPVAKIHFGDNKLSKFPVLLDENGKLLAPLMHSSSESKNWYQQLFE